MSHELRTPMHAILSFAHMGTKKLETAPKKMLGDYFTNISVSGNRLLILLNDLLDLSKLESGQIDFNIHKNDLRSIVELVVIELNELLQQKSLNLSIEDSDIDTVAYFDSDKILQVIQNLLSNALKFSGEKGNISISFADSRLMLESPETDSTGIAALSLIMVDEGIGIPPGELDLVFDQFVQSSKTHTGAGGTGLGLAICKEIIEGHRGTIKAAHNPQGGAIFTFAIPRSLF